MRCLALAEALRLRACDVVFLSYECDRGIVGEVHARGFHVEFLPAVGDWDQEVDAAATLAWLAARAPKPAWIVVDHYGLDVTWETRVRTCGVSLLIIDDLADRPHDCDAILDQTVVSGSEDRYATLVPSSARRLYGGGYALLRPEFGKALQRRRDQAGALTNGSILLFLGATDAAAMTLPLAEHLRCALGPERLVVLIGKTNPLGARLHEWCAAHGVQGLSNVENMATLLADCRLLVGACGMTAVEAQSIGVPCLLVPLSPVQRCVAQQFVSDGRAVLLDPADVLERRVVLNEVARAMAIPPDAPAVTAFSATGARDVAAVMMGDPND